MNTTDPVYFMANFLPLFMLILCFAIIFVWYIKVIKKEGWFNSLVSALILLGAVIGKWLEFILTEVIKNV